MAKATTDKSIVRVERWATLSESSDLPPVYEASEPDKPKVPATIPGTPESAAEKVKHAGQVEGRPALNEAKDGPKRLAGEMGLAAIAVIIAAVGVGAWFGVWGGLAALVVGMLGLAFNPVIGAMTLRMQDRADAMGEPDPRDERERGPN